MNMSTIASRISPARLARAGVTAAAMGLVALSASAQSAADYPTKPVRIILAFGTGGVSDIVSRLLAEKLEADLGQRFIVENKPGGGGTVALQAAYTSDPDGYTLVNIGNSGTIKATLMPNLEYSQQDDFEPVSPIAEFGLVIVTGPNSEWDSLEEAVAYAKEHPGELNIGTNLVGSTQHLSALLFRSVADIDAAIIPYKSSPDLMGGVARGEVDLVFAIIAGAKTAIESGQVRPLATTMAERSPILPDVPTVQEQGVEPYVVASWNAYAVPTGTPDEIKAKLNEALQKALKLPDVVEQMQAFGIVPFYGTPETVRERQEADVQRWHDIIMAAGLEIQS